MADAEATLEAPDDEVGPPDADAAEQEGAVEAKAPKAPKEKKPSKKDAKKGGKDAAPDALPDGPSVAGHPRAARATERAKGWGALIGLCAGFYLSLPTHTVAEAGIRGLLAGVVLYAAAWAGSVFFWRRMVMVEIRAREQQLIAAARAAQARAAAETARGAGG